MNQTAMWNEIHDQPAVARKIIAEYLPQADYFKARCKGKKELILTGMGASLYACHMAKYAFYQYCQWMPQIIPADELSYRMPVVTSDTLVIFISQSGESYETKVVSSELKARGIEFWGITNNPDSSLARNASKVMLLHSGVEISSATKTNLASFLILAIIAGGWNEKVKHALTKLPDIINTNLKGCLKKVESVTQKLKNEQQLYILGMGSNAATAVQGALLFQEKDFIHAAGMSVSDFRHGTVEVIEPGLPILLLASGEAYTKFAMIHADYLRAAGAVVYCCTDTDLEINFQEELTISVMSSSEEILAPASFLLVLQLLAEGIARAKQLNVDGFRYLSKVVDQYHQQGETL